MQLEFQNEMNIEIIEFWLIHLEFGLDLSDIDLWDIDLSDTDFVDAYISSKHFVCLQNVSKTSLQDVWQNDLEDEKSLCWRSVEDVFKTPLEDQEMLALGCN